MAIRTAAATTIVDATPADVWRLLSDVATWPSWTPTMTSIRALGPGPLAVDARFRVEQPGLRPVVMEVTAVDPGRSFTWCAVQPGLRTEATHVVSAEGSHGARVELSFSLAGPLAALVWLRYGRMIRRFVETEAQCLRSAAERPA